MSAIFEVHDRVEYVADGPLAYLRGVHGSIHAVHTLDSGAVVADVLFDGHTALWAIPTKHLAHLAEAVAATPELRSFGFNLVTIAPDGTHGGPRLRLPVTREEAEAEHADLAPYMTDGYTTVLVELREVAR